MTISIVTPSYNQVEWLEQTMRSVLAQSFHDLEYVVVDGGSQDGSLDIIIRYEKALAHWISEPDKGHADGINKGFHHTTGEIMGWINSSDIYYPWTLQTVADVFRDIPEAQWITGIATHLDIGSAPQNVHPAKWNVYDFLSGNYRWMQQESVFWRRSLWDAAGGCLNTGVKLACDFELWLRFMKLAPLYHVNTILAGFRYHDDRRGASGREQYAIEARDQFNHFRESFSFLDNQRARFVRATNGGLGRFLRKGVKTLGIIPWYAHLRITRDFKSKRWVRVTG